MHDPIDPPPCCSTASAISIKLPPFWPADPELVVCANRSTVYDQEDIGTENEVRVRRLVPLTRVRR